jgi:hypothetical protein
MNTFAPSCKILTARLCRSGLAAGVNTNLKLILLELVVCCNALLGSGCIQWSVYHQLNGKDHIDVPNADRGWPTNKVDHWPVQVHSVDSGSN